MARIKIEICTTTRGMVTVQQHFAETVIAGTDSLTCIAKAVADAGRVITEGHGEKWPKSDAIAVAEALGGWKVNVESDKKPRDADEPA